MTILGAHDAPDATPLTEEELEGLKPTWVATRADLNAVEFDNIALAERWAFEGRKVANVRRLLESKFCDGVHRRMFSEVWAWAGLRRKRMTNIGVDPDQIAVQMRDLFLDVHHWHDNGTHSSVEIAARLHHRLVSIHPYPNGNGRHARLMADLYLHLIDHRRLTWGSTQLATDGEVRRRYIAALRAADRHEIEPLLEFVIT